jgi:paraquat-inducible protein B
MSKQASKTLIGGFVVGAVVLAVIGVLIFGSGRFFSERGESILYFDESVQGLNVGAPVMFKGVKVGSVTDIKSVINPEDLSVVVPVLIETDPVRFSLTGGATGLAFTEAEREEITEGLIERGLRAQLVSQSMVTGQLMVALDFYPDTPANFVGDGTIHEIPTVPSTRQELSSALNRLNLEELAAKLSSTLSGIERTVNSPEIPETIRNVNGAVTDIRKLVQNVDSRIEPLTTTIEQTIQDYGKVAQDARGLIKPVGSSVDETLEEIKGLVSNLNGVVKKIDAAAEPLPETLAHIRRISRDLNELVSSQRPNLQRTIENFSVTSQNIRDLSEQAKQDPSSVFFGGPPPKRKRGQ